MMYTDDIKYLGFTFSSDQKVDKDLPLQLKMLYTTSNRLLRLFYHCSTVVKITLFRSYSTCFYCLLLWTHYKKSTQIKFMVAFNNVGLYRRLLKLPQRSSAVPCIYAINNIDSFEDLDRNGMFGLTERLNNCENTNIKCINNS